MAAGGCQAFSAGVCPFNAWRGVKKFRCISHSLPQSALCWMFLTLQRFIRSRFALHSRSMLCIAVP